MEITPLEKIKLLVLQNPKSRQLLKNEIEGSTFDDFSQLPDAPDRELWWPNIRRVIGFLLYCLVDLHIRQAAYHAATDAKIAELIELVEKRKVEPVVQQPVVQIEAEEVPPPNFVPGASWEPFENRAER